MASKQNHERPRCGVVFKGRPACKQYAGHGTKHVGTGACSRHGGASKGAPVGNDRAVTTGQHQTIFASLLTGPELEVFAQAASKGKLEHAKEELALITVREFRMLDRINKLQAVAGGMTVTEVTQETIAKDDDEEKKPARPFSDQWASEADVDDPEVQRAARQADGADTSDLLKVKTKREGVLGQIQSIETALTAVQKEKQKLIRLVHDLEKGGAGGAGAGGAPGDSDALARRILEELGAGGAG